MSKKDYLSSQLITYLGNKRKLVQYIEEEIVTIQQLLGRNLISFDGFSGSGVVARMLKYHSDILCVNDMEPYSHIINQCYLSNPSEKKVKEIEGLSMNSTPWSLITRVSSVRIIHLRIPRIFKKMNVPFTLGRMLSP